LPAWDIGAGLTAAVSLLAAVHDRSCTGHGREIQVPLSNVAFATLSSLGNIAEVATFGKDRPRYGNALYGSFGRDFATADGQRVMIVAITQRQWLGLLTALDLQSDVVALEQRHNVDFTRDEGARFVHREDLFEIVERAVARWSFGELPDLFDRLGVCWGAYQTVQEAMQKDSRLSSANPMFESVSQPSAHTDDILARDLGLSCGEIGRLHDDRIVSGPNKE
jgi:2-methylfumaryl-CoA isomerase